MRAIIDGARAGGPHAARRARVEGHPGAYGIPTVPTRVARDEAEAVAAARELGFPVVVKLWSRTITHKTDVGGVQLDLADAEAVVARVSTTSSARSRPRRRRRDFLGVTVQPMSSSAGATSS